VKDTVFETISEELLDRSAAAKKRGDRG